MMIVSHEDQAREVWRPGVETRMYVSAGQGATQLCIFEQWVAPAAGPPTHWHPVEEVLTVISGKAEMWLDDEPAVLTAGQSLIVPAHRRHGFRNVGTDTLHIQAVVAAPFLELTFDGSVEPVRRGALADDRR
jgi:mannose-6-phosphate isomerase-like protein (cupin superfamily)